MSATTDDALAVVVASIGRADVVRTVASIAASARAAGVRVDVVVPWQAAEPPPSMIAARCVTTFPVGLAYARNRGLSATTAPLVAFVDDDEVVAEEWVRALVTAFASYSSVGGVFGAVSPLPGDGIPYCVVTGEAPRLFDGRDRYPWAVGSGGNMAFRRDALSAIGGFDPWFGAGAPGRSGEETDVIVRLLARGTALLWWPEAVVGHPPKSPAEHLASRRPYAFGAAAVCRRNRVPAIAARYLKAIGSSYITGLWERDSRRRREARCTLAGFVQGATARRRALSPLSHLGRAPVEIARWLRGPVTSLPAEYGRLPRFAYRCGDVIITAQILPAGVGEGAPDDEVVAVVNSDVRWSVATA